MRRKMQETFDDDDDDNNNINNIFNCMCAFSWYIKDIITYVYWAVHYLDS